ncbi:MAG: DUF5110 domain-containing protein [Clostridia bacterium]|nr:DUF5110 domain-containing protein [Clostridia bacterium]
MANHLPDYLCMQADAAPNQNQVFTCGDVRFTVITPQLIRIEQRKFTDDATLAVTCRSFCSCSCEARETQSTFTLWTDALELCYYPDQLLCEGLTIRHLGLPAFTWNYGEKPLLNLGGTASTLDGMDGACEIGDGVCAVDGFAWIDDSKSPLMKQDGWFAPRENCSDVYFFGYGHEYTRAVQDYCLLTGKVQRLPAYALGNWWSRYYAYTQDSYLALMDAFKNADIPLSVGIVDMDWHVTRGENRPYHSDFFSDGWTGYTWNESLFPDYRAFIAALHEKGLKTALNLHPAAGVRAHEKQYDAMAKAMGVDPQTKETIPCNWLSPEFLKAYFEILHFPYEEDGVDFWWLDWQQGSDFEKIVGKGKNSGGLNAITPLWMLNHMHFLASQRAGKRGMIFSRFAGYGSQRYPIGFSGDTYVTWDSLRFQPYFTATASNIGYGWWSHDIGGHMGGVRDDELAARWVQFGVFSPIFRLHSSNSVFNCREPWTYNPRSEQAIKAFMRLRHQLFPYLNTMNARCDETQIPLMLPMYHTNPEEKAAYEVPNQYWFGTEMITAPITEPMDESGLASAKVFFPTGLWTDWFTGFVYNGGQIIDICRPLEQMPVFLKAGALVPMQAHEAGRWKLGNAAHMELYVAPGADGSFMLVEDDGESLAYRQGKVSTTRLTLEWKEHEAVLTIGMADDAAGVLPDVRTWDVHFIGFSMGCTFELNGMTVKASYNAKRHMYTVSLTCAAGESGKIAIRCEAGLTHDGSDAYERCIDLLVHAQIPLSAKIQLHEKLDKAMKRMKNGQRVMPGHFGSDRYRTLGLALYEMMTGGTRG